MGRKRSCVSSGDKMNLGERFAKDPEPNTYDDWRGGRRDGCFPLSAAIYLPLDLVRKENSRFLKKPSDGIGMDE